MKGKSLSPMASWGKTLGGQKDMQLKTTRPIIKKVWTVIAQTIWLLHEDDPRLKDIKMFGGSWIHIVQFRRPIMGALENLWAIILDGIPRQFRWAALADDMVQDAGTGSACWHLVGAGCRRDSFRFGRLRVGRRSLCGHRAYCSGSHACWRL